ncbi:N-acetylmannosamine-6-phosphate 2-epimerase [Natronospirillum operosum]|uniref:N-acetylmannosamine-6-phosphate 2-epimerase n=1 Tax=Natronospirillum operosum TaxID=2759953 RepID=UPI00197C616D|nr:putative N-acetylmannosamine-6-phosphate 2-epimerase [Natronospirillum operosum]
MLEHLRHQLIVSCQPVQNGPLDHPEVVAALSLAALAGGARALRIEGLDNLAAVRAVTDVPIIGLIKHDLDDFPVRITPFEEDVDALVAAGADIVAFDATDRPRPVPVSALLARVRRHGKLAMADCSNPADGLAAAALGCDIVGTTLSGYTGNSVAEGPDLDLLRELRNCGRFLIAEGRYHSPAQAAQAIAAGAQAVVVGSAITRPEHITRWFADQIADARFSGGKAL